MILNKNNVSVHWTTETHINQSFSPLCTLEKVYKIRKCCYVIVASKILGFKKPLLKSTLSLMKLAASLDLSLSAFLQSFFFCNWTLASHLGIAEYSLHAFCQGYGSVARISHFYSCQSTILYTYGNAQKVYSRILYMAGWTIQKSPLSTQINHFVNLFEQFYLLRTRFLLFSIYLFSNVNLYNIILI